MHPRVQELTAYLNTRRSSLREAVGPGGDVVAPEAPVERWAPQAIRAGADMVLFTSPAHARRAIRALLPLARRGELDTHVARTGAAGVPGRRRPPAGMPDPPDTGLCASGANLRSRRRQARR